MLTLIIIDKALYAARFVQYTHNSLKGFLKQGKYCFKQTHSDCNAVARDGCEPVAPWL